MAIEKWTIDGNKLFELVRDDHRINGCTFSRVKEYMDDSTVDSVEAVHGRWEFSHTTTVEKYDVVKCSNCGHEAFAIAIYVKEGHYCPNCGARMDLED